METDLETKQKVRGRTRTFDNEKTLDLAIQCYWLKGPTQVSVNEICTLAGVSKPSLYREFTSEDGLMAASLERYADQVLSHVLGLLNRDNDFQHVLESLVDYALREPTESAPAGCLFAKMRLDKALLGPRTNQVIETLRESAITAFASWLAEASDEQGVVLPASIPVSAAYLDDQLTHLANRMTEGENVQALRVQATISMSVFKSG